MVYGFPLSAPVGDKSEYRRLPISFSFPVFVFSRTVRIFHYVEINRVDHSKIENKIESLGD